MNVESMLGPGLTAVIVGLASYAAVRERVTRVEGSLKTLETIHGAWLQTTTARFDSIEKAIRDITEERLVRSPDEVGDIRERVGRVERRLDHLEEASRRSGRP